MLKRQVPAWALAVAAPLALGCAVAWAFEVRPGSLVWGSVGEFVGGLGTVVVVALAFHEIRAERRLRRKEELDRQRGAAMSVGVSSQLEHRPNTGALDCVVKVVNLSPYPIDRVVVVVPDQTFKGANPAESTAGEEVIGTLLPGNDEAANRTFTVMYTKWEPSFEDLNGQAYVLFTDVWGQSWCRGSGSLEAMDVHPRLEQFPTFKSEVAPPGESGDQDRPSA